MHSKSRVTQLMLFRAGKEVGIWQLRDLPPLKTWVKGRAILIGDASHPSKSWISMYEAPISSNAYLLVLPHVAAGAMSAIEDAEALSAFLRGVAPEGVHDALMRTFRVRYKRASECQSGSRKEGLFSAPNPNTKEDALRRWDYPGAEKWEKERSDMILDA
jgi:salicylate hydroxylase